MKGFEKVADSTEAVLKKKMLRYLVLLFSEERHDATKLLALGRLQYLKFLSLLELGSVKYIGCEFYGLGSSDGAPTGGEDSVKSLVVFPKLRTLDIVYMEDCEDWVLPFRRGVEIFP
ncbi:hypothetical protein IFM89_002875 [Coptis chinensis]|uniref:Uncharacterized protein n=1 Tax=Coptis chinensis TaxID=261450 RepID=A0A835LE35_9MAGN|nr:hypothetical protein IFM89_002875 [Coptis chinensis]